MHRLRGACVFAACATATACGSDTASPSPAGAQLGWLLDTINSGDAATEPISEHFTDAYLATHPAKALADALLKVHDRQAPLALMGDDLPAKPGQLLVRAQDSKSRWMRIGLTTEDAPPHRMSALSIAPNGDLDPTLQAWPDVLNALSTLTPNIGFIAATLRPDGCSSLQELGSTRELAIGSNLKLYILTALGTEVAAGRRAWTDTVAIRDDWKSLSPLEFEAAGTVHTLQDLAERMVSASDNSAADHLLYTLGRATVEKAVTDSGHAAPSKMLPFLSTWEAFWLVLLATPAQQQAYVTADVAARRAILDMVPHAATDRDAANAALLSFTAPRLLDTVGWFASAKDLCAVTARLMRTGEGFDILLESHGLPDLRNDYVGLGYKAGSEPGVLSVSYAIARAPDGAWFFIGMILNDGNDAFDREHAFYLLGAARGRLRFPP